MNMLFTYFDADHSGHVDFEEFAQLVECVTPFREQFEFVLQHGKDLSKSIDDLVSGLSTLSEEAHENVRVTATARSPGKGRPLKPLTLEELRKVPFFLKGSEGFICSRCQVSSCNMVFFSFFFRMMIIGQFLGLFWQLCLRFFANFIWAFLFWQFRFFNFCGCVFGKEIWSRLFSRKSSMLERCFARGHLKPINFPKKFNCNKNFMSIQNPTRT